MNDNAALCQQLVQFSPDALVIVDAESIVRFANETTRVVFGHPPAELIGRSIEVLLPERFRVNHAGHVAAFHRRPGSREMGLRDVELIALRADGSEFPAGIRLSPFEWQGARYVAAAVRDMTERRAIDASLVAARAEAERANSAKSRFLATASHDLRQPMHSMRLLNAAMRKLEPQNVELRELLQRQDMAIENATHLLDALLDVSRLESGAISPQITSVHLGLVFADLQREFAAAASSKSLSLEFCDSRVVLSTDRMLLTRLLQNLVGNALKYTERGYVRVTQRIEADGLVLGVEDSGIGIPEDKLDRIFDEYYQVDPHGAPRLGVGLGLAIVREVSRLLGYAVAVRSRLGEGTQVTVRVPPQSLQAEPPSGAPPPPCRLVLVEDNVSVRTAMELYLTMEGYRTLSVGSAGEALALAAQLGPDDILLADYRLGDSMSGIDVLHRLRAQLGWELPAILLSGDLESVLRVVKSPIPHCRFLSKPVDTNALSETIVWLCGRPTGQANEAR